MAVGAGREDDDVGSEAPAAGVSVRAQLEVLYETQFVRLAGLARLLGPELDTEDVVQEAFARTIQRSRALADHDLERYVQRVVINLCHGGLRRVRSHRQWFRREQATPRMSPSVDHDLLRDEQARRIAVVLRDLPRRQRECVTLRFYLDCSYREIADTLGISEGAVKSHIHRGVRTVGRALGEEP